MGKCNDKVNAPSFEKENLIERLGLPSLIGALSKTWNIWKKQGAVI